MGMLGPKRNWLINAIFSPDGHRLISHGPDNVVDVWATTDESMVTTIECSKRVTAIAYDFTGDQLACGHHDGSVSVWDLKNMALIKDFRAWDSEVSDLAFLKCNQNLVVHSDMGLGVFSVKAAALTVKINSGISLGGVFAYERNTHRILWTNWNSELSASDAESGELVAIFEMAPKGEIVAVACSVSGRYLAYATHSREIQVIDVQTHRLLHALTLDDEVSKMSFAPCNEELLAVAVGLGGCLVVDVEAPRVVVSRDSFADWQMSSIEFSPISSQVAVAMWRGWQETLYRDATRDEYEDRGIISVPVRKVGSEPEGAILMFDMKFWAS